VGAKDDGGRGLVIYTLHGHKLRFFKELKAQGEQGIEIGLVSGHGLVQALGNGSFEGRELGVVLRVQAFLFNEFPDSLKRLFIMHLEKVGRYYDS
jgi:hypothetical protein